MNITLPWPPSGLSPNARLHWAKLARLKKQYRAVCAGQARIQGARAIKADALHITVEFVPPTRRAFDLDNALARMKSGLDGLADVLKVDDSRWELTIRKAPAGTIGGFVLVGVEVMT